MKNKLRKYWPTIIAATIALAIFLPSLVFAAVPKTGTDSVELGWVGNMVVQAVGGIVQILISVLGNLTVALIHILLMVASYNEYMSSPVITTGWVIVRDVANLFFVAIILVVSIGSIVNPERFGGVKKVFRILLYALLVNFSRTIAGLFIDISQLIMLTFVNGFAQAAGGNFVEVLGITKITDVSSTSTSITFSGAMGQILLGLFMFVIITVIIAIMVVALVVRMVTLWMLVVLSPLAFALGSSELTHKHYAKWWEKFSAELTTGPIVAFFLWLSLVTFQSSAGPGSGSTIVGPSGLKDNAAGAESTKISCGQGVACEQDNLVRFIVATVMLLMGLSFSKEFSGLGGSLASAATSKGKQYARGALNYAGKKSWAGAKKVGGVAAAPVTVPLARLGDGYNRVKGMAGRALGRVSTNQNWAVRNLLGTFTRPMSIGLTTSAGKRDAEKDKKAREELQYASPEALSGVITSITTTDAEKRAASMKIVKDKAYIGANADSADAAEKARATIFNTAAGHLRGIRAGLDKDVDEIVKDGKEKRPDAFIDPKKNHEVEIKSTGAGLTRDDFNKLNLDGISEKDLKTLVGSIRPEVMAAIMERASGKKADRLNNIIMPRDADKAHVEVAIDSGVSLSGVDVHGAPATPGARPGINKNIASTAVQHGAPDQIHENMRQLLKNKSANEIRDAHADDVRNNVKWGGTGVAAGFAMTAAGERMADENLRNAEAATILGASMKDLYRIKEDGDFADARGRNSFRETVSHSPARLSFVLNMKPNQMKREVMDELYNNINTADLSQMAAMAKTDDEIKTLTELVRNIDTIAGMRGDTTRQMELVWNPDLNHLLP